MAGGGPGRTGVEWHLLSRSRKTRLPGRRACFSGVPVCISAGQGGWQPRRAGQRRGGGARQAGFSSFPRQTPGSDCLPPSVANWPHRSPDPHPEPPSELMLKEQGARGPGQADTLGSRPPCSPTHSQHRHTPSTSPVRARLQLLPVDLCRGKTPLPPHSLFARSALSSPSLCPSLSCLPSGQEPVCK